MPPPKPPSSRGGGKKNFRRKRTANGANATTKGKKKVVVGDVELKKSIKGQAGVNAFLNQHMVHVHSDTAFCPLTDDFRAEYDEKVVDFMRTVKRLREVNKAGIGREDITHDERRLVLQTRRTNEQMYHTLLGISKEYMEEECTRVENEIDTEPIRSVRKLNDNDKYHAYLDKVDFLPRPFDNLLRQKQAYEKFLQAGRTVVLRLRAQRRLNFFKERGRAEVERQREIDLDNQELEEERKRRGTMDLVKERYRLGEEGMDSESILPHDAIIACSNPRKTHPYNQLRDLHKTETIIVTQPLQPRVNASAPTQAPLDWGKLSLEQPSEARRLGYVQMLEEHTLSHMACARKFDIDDLQLHQLLSPQQDQAFADILQIDEEAPSSMKETDDEDLSDLDTFHPHDIHGDTIIEENEDEEED